MLSGETPRTLGVGLIISVLVVGLINAHYLIDQVAPAKVATKGLVLQGVIKLDEKMLDILKTTHRLGIVNDDKKSYDGTETCRALLLKVGSWHQWLMS
jgi:hypothetical protein